MKKNKRSFSEVLTIIFKIGVIASIVSFSLLASTACLYLAINGDGPAPDWMNVWGFVTLAVMAPTLIGWAVMEVGEFLRE